MFVHIVFCSSQNDLRLPRNTFFYLTITSYSFYLYPTIIGWRDIKEDSVASINLVSPTAVTQDANPIDLLTYQIIQDH